jgi:hypothetical protein
MGYILFYSNHCVKCQKIIQYISKTSVVKKIHFICIDNRYRDYEGNMLIILENGQNMILPPNITRVPALVLIIQNNRVLFGVDEITGYFSEITGGIEKSSVNFNHKSSNLKTANKEIEPIPYILNSIVGFGASGFGVTSDQYSYYDTPTDEYNLEKGNAGTRQMHNYVSIKANPIKIWAPEETYKADKIGEVSLEKLQQERNTEINMPGFTPHLPPPPN